MPSAPLPPHHDPLADAAALLPWFSQPLVIVTAAAEGRRGGQVAVTQVSTSIVPDRPRIVLGLMQRNVTHDLVAASGRFALQFIGPDDGDLVRRFGFHSQRDGDKFAEADWALDAYGQPILERAWGVLWGRVVNAMDGGDNTIFLADVEATWRRPGAPATPVHWRELLPGLPAAWIAEYEAMMTRHQTDSAGRMDAIHRARPG